MAWVAGIKYGTCGTVWILSLPAHHPCRDPRGPDFLGGVGSLRMYQEMIIRHFASWPQVSPQ